MCHDAEARPPLPPIAGGAGIGEPKDVVLTAEDQNRFAARTVTAEAPGGPGIVVLPDVRGLHPFYLELAQRFAEAGVHATAIDYYGRTAGVGIRNDRFDWQPHRERTQPDTVARDVAAAVAHVRSPNGGRATSVFTVGFCFGGRKSFNEAGRGLGLAGVIGFYGRVGPDSRRDHEAPVALAGGYACPVLGLFGGADEGIPREHVEAFRQALDAAEVANDLTVYDGAPHSFFDRTFPQFREECDDAWTRVLGFIQSNG